MFDPSAEVASPPALLPRDVPEKAPAPGPIGLFVNTRARAGREGYEAARKALEARGLNCAVCEPVDDPERLPAAVEQALASGVKLLIIGGGDGTVRSVAASAVHHGATLGVLPLGTGNDFARALGIPLEVAAAIDVIAHGTTAQVDLGVVNGKTFLNACSVGLTTEITRRLDAGLKRRLGRLAYPVAAAVSAWRTQPFRVRLEVDGVEQLRAPVLLVVVGNSRYQGGGHVITPAAAPNDRRLNAYAVLAHGDREHPARLADFTSMARVGWHTRKGLHLALPCVVAFRGRSLRLETEPALQLDIDGELCGDTPADLQVVDGSLSVRVPARGARHRRRHPGSGPPHPGHL